MNKQLKVVAVSIVAAALASIAATAQEEEKPQRAIPFRGKIAEANAEAKTIKLEGKTGRVLKVTDQTQLRYGSGDAKWDQIKAGEEVRGTYRKNEDGTLEAVLVKVGPKSEEDKERDEKRAERKRKKAEKEGGAMEDKKE